MADVTRRGFLQTVALAGLTRKSGRAIAGGFVHESQTIGHRLRDGASFPAPRDERRVSIVIVGGGIAGLSAAWRLQKLGLTDLALLEMDPEAGGNARSGANEVSAYPWAAHYVPVPGPRATLVRELFAELGVREADGTWQERALCQAPQERLFLHGRWQEGLEPRTGPTARDRDQMSRFEARIEALRASGEFTIPSALGVKVGSPLDRMSMAEWLSREGLDSPWLRWSVDYACRDDYGALGASTSAWAGIHYFAAREKDDPGPLTWPEGNGWISKRLLERVGPFVHADSVVYRIAKAGTKWRVLTPTVAWITDVVIFAAPSFLASRLIEGGPPAPDFEYSPWVTANLTLDRWPVEHGLAVAWDNVIFDSPGLGYVVATHQTLRTFVPRTVWTYYWALADGTPRANRQWLLAQDWGTLRDRILDDLARAHPDIRDCVSRVDICRMGHAMIRPTPGFLESSARRLFQSSKDGLFYAHSDVSGISIFEEAQYRGVIAAESAAARVGRVGAVGTWGQSPANTRGTVPRKRAELMPRTIGPIQLGQNGNGLAHGRGCAHNGLTCPERRRRFMTLTRYALTAGLVLAMAGPAAAQHSRRGGGGGGGGQAHAAAPAPRGPVATPRQGPAPRSYAAPRAVAPRGVAPYRAPGQYGYTVPRSNYGYAVPRSNGYYHGGGAWRGYYPHGGYYGHGHSYGYGYGYWRPYPYYAFHPHFSIGFGLYLGYPVPYPYLYSYAYPYPAPYPVPYAAPYPSYPAPAPYPYGNQYPQQQPYQQPYQQQYQDQYSNPYPEQYQQGAQQQNSIDVTPGVTGGLSFNITPSTAEVIVDGENFGQVGNYSPNAQQPLALAPGRHRVEIRQPGYRNIAFDVDIVAGQVLPYQGTLQAN